jgi:hypothetical protein
VLAGKEPPDSSYGNSQNRLYFGILLQIGFQEIDGEYE